MKKEDFKVGQTVCLLSNRYSEFEFHVIEKRIMEVKVLTVGRKYITVDYCGGMRFDITNDFRQDAPYTPTYTLYLSKVDILKEFKRKETIAEIHKKIKYDNRLLKRMTDDDLKTILNIIRKYER